jgi:hypothetical protein
MYSGANIFFFNMQLWNLTIIVMDTSKEIGIENGYGFFTKCNSEIID